MRYCPFGGRTQEVTMSINVRLLVNCAYGAKGAIVRVKRNEAHALIENRQATLKYRDKMMRPKKYKRKRARNRIYR